MMPTGRKMSEMTFLFWGAGSAGVGIANLIAYAIHHEEKMSIEEARKKIWLVDSKGLVTKVTCHPFISPIPPLSYCPSYTNPSSPVSGVVAMSKCLNGLPTRHTAECYQN
jgi:hypothetical protein